MRINATHCFIKSLRLRQPYTISYETVDRCDNAFMHVTTRDGYAGWGCAAPSLPVTGETAEDVKDAFNTVIEPLLKGKDVFEYGRILETIKKELPGKPSARAMVDMALYDLMAQKAGVSLYRLLGGYRHAIPTSVTIGIMPVEETLRRAGEFIKQDFKILKIKGGKNVQEDIEKLIRIRALVGTEVKLRFDANQGYSLEDSTRFLEGVEKVKIELLEQPTRRSDFELLKQVTGITPVPVMADESLLSLNDVFRISRNRCSDLINIKLMKTGGIHEAMHINSVAMAAGIAAMVGCMDESSLAIAAGLHFALSRRNTRYADLDGHMDLLDDPFNDMLHIVKGELIPPQSVGLGWIGLEKIGI
jgi:L-alanine-DL-glutamate epimerase-like enolase superfamily enzyme